MAVRLLQHRRHGFCGLVHCIKIAITDGAHDFVADDTDFVFGSQMASSIIIGHNPLVLNGVIDYKKLVKIVFLVEIAIPPLLESVEQGIAGRRHLAVIENEDGLHLSRSGLRFGSQCFVILVNRKVKRRIQSLMLPWF